MEPTELRSNRFRCSRKQTITGLELQSDNAMLATLEPWRRIKGVPGENRYMRGYHAVLNTNLQLLSGTLTWKWNLMILTLKSNLEPFTGLSGPTFIILVKKTRLQTNKITCKRPSGEKERERHVKISEVKKRPVGFYIINITRGL